MALCDAWWACLEEAWEAYRAGSLPIGAAYVDGAGSVALRGRNRVGEKGAPPPLIAGSRLAHAEMNVLAQVPPEAHARMAQGELFTSLEPCPMCFGAALMTGVRRIRYGASDRWAGAADLQTATPYVESKRMAVCGPEPTVQAVSLVLLTDYWLGSRSPRKAELVAAFGAADEQATALGREWFSAGRLSEMARAGRPIADVAREVWARVGVRSP